jgi:hypothetical protein
MGQTRPLGDVGSISGLPPKAAVQRTLVDGSNVPLPDSRTAAKNAFYSISSSARATSIGGERERELIDRLAPPAHTGAYDFRYSVLYLGPSSLAFLLRCSRSCSVRLGGGAVRASTGSPIAMKNSSCPGGVHMQSIRAAPPEIFL